MAAEYRYYANQIAIIDDGKLIIYDIGKTIDKAIEDKSTSRIKDIEDIIGDSTLNTTDKTLTGAVNEVLTSIQELQNNYGECEALAAQIVAGEV